MKRRFRLLLAGLALAASFAWRGHAADEKAVALPPFIVEEATKGPPWRYGMAMGYEVLSRCNDATTRRVVESHYRLHLLLDEILPPSMQLKTSVPPALILYDEELQPAASKEVIARMLRNAGPDVPAEDYAPVNGMRGVRMPAPARHNLTFLPNLRLWDRDSMMVFMISRKDDFDGDRLSLTHDYVSFLLRSRLPALPLWFVSGFLSLHREIKYANDRLTVEPMEWISETFTAAVKKDPKTAPPVAPLEDFFLGHLSDPAPGAVPFNPVSAWQAQAELVVRWGLDEHDRARRAAFHKFVELSATRGASEALFQECFGFDFATAREQIAAYLPTAVRRSMRFKPETLAKVPPWTLVNASDAQIARLKGDWERLEIGYVKATSPDLADKYRDQARRTLKRAYDRDVRDPQLLAVMGLCECDAGEEAKAREYLEAAVQLGKVRPRAYYELARLRFTAACAHPEASNGLLSLTQILQVLEPLFEARALQPPLPEVYELMADVWLHAGPTATRRHLAVFDEGVQLFPRRTSLALRAAEANLRYGFREEAEVLANIAARNANDEATRQQVAALQKQLETK